MSNLKNNRGRVIKAAIYIFLVASAVTTITTTHPALAQPVTPTTTLGYEPLVNIPGLPPNNLTLEGYLDSILGIGVGALGLFAVLMGVINGAKYTFGVSPSLKAESRKRLMEILGWLLFGLAAWLLLFIINPNLLEFNLSLDRIQVQQPLNPPGPPGPPLPPDGRLDFDPGINSQSSHSSNELGTFLDCMANELPGNVGRVSSISDSEIVNGTFTFEECAEGGQSIGCAHRVNSCHYGGQNCVGESYAVDFGDEENAIEIGRAARKCDFGAALIPEGDHIHISVSAGSNFCGCR